MVVQSRYGNITEDSADAWIRFDCPGCGGSQCAKVAYRASAASDRPPVQWGRCVNCFMGFVINSGQVSPSRFPMSDVQGLEPETHHAWHEVRSCLSVGATTAAVHICRKILFHVAAEKGLPAKNDRDRAPTFAACIEHLQEHGYVTPPMVKWVEKIKDVGNEAAHELDVIPAEKAELVATFTMQLLVLTYQMPHMLGDALAVEADDSDESDSGPTTIRI